MRQKSKGLYVSHLKKYKKQIKQLHKSQIAWAVIITGLVLNAIYLAVLCICNN